MEIVFMPNFKIINEIKGLLAKGLDQKALLAGSSNALRPLREAAILSDQTEHLLWANVPKYRLAHLLFRYAKTETELTEISELLQAVIRKQSSRRLDFLCQILLIAVTCRLRTQGINTKNVDLAQLTREAASNVRFTENESFNNNTVASNLQGELFNLLELSTYFSGEEYKPLLGLCPSPNYIELTPLNTSDQNLWRIALSSGKLDAFAYTKEEAKLELEDQLKASKSDFYYVFENSQPVFFKKDRSKLMFKRYANTGLTSSPAFLVRLHGKQGDWLSRNETLNFTNSSPAGDETLVLRHIRTSIRDALGISDIIETNYTLGDRLGSQVKIVGMIPQKYASDFFSYG